MARRAATRPFLFIPDELTSLICLRLQTVFVARPLPTTTDTPDLVPVTSDKTATKAAAPRLATASSRASERAAARTARETRRREKEARIRAGKDVEEAEERRKTKARLSHR